MYLSFFYLNYLFPPFSGKVAIESAGKINLTNHISLCVGGSCELKGVLLLQHNLREGCGWLTIRQQFVVHWKRTRTSHVDLENLKGKPFCHIYRNLIAFKGYRMPMVS